MVPRERRKLRLAFVDSLDQPVLDSADIRHFRRVLRMEVGSLLNVSDGEGSWRCVRLGSDEGELTIDGEIQVSAPVPTPTTVAFAPTKGDRPEWAIQKLTELGISRIVAVETQRSVVRWDAGRAAKQVHKWRRVAREAAMQSRRVFLPRIDPQVDLKRFITEQPLAVLCEPGGRPLDASIDKTVVIGPEGGFTKEELTLANNVDLSTGTILRTETAALVSATMLVTKQ